MGLYRHHPPVAIAAAPRLDTQISAAGAHNIREHRVQHCLTENQRQVIGGRIVIVIGQAMRIHEMAFACADLRSLDIHQLGKAGHRATGRLGQGLGGIVARLQHQPIKQILRHRHLARTQPDAAGRRAGGLWTHRHPRIQIQALQGHQCGQHLGGAGRRQTQTRFLGIDHLAARRIHQHCRQRCDWWCRSRIRPLLCARRDCHSPKHCAQ